ncbi:hypothetical protein CLAIMM_06308 [Cladophialophora immunda]|nr:hypothetical protein CLAIMM_06308 [Cladophialophora immunda]
MPLASLDRILRLQGFPHQWLLQRTTVSTLRGTLPMMAYAFPDVFQTLHQDVIATRSPGNEPRRSTHGVGFTEMRLIKSNLPPNSAGMDRLESPNQVISRDGLKHPLESVHIGGSISIDVWLSSKEERMQTAEGRRYVYLRHLGPESLDGGLAFLPPSSWLIVTTIGDPVRVRIFAYSRNTGGLLFESPDKSARALLFENPYILGLACFASLGGFLFGYDQGVVSGILTMESFGARFPHVYLSTSFKGWFVSILLLSMTDLCPFATGMRYADYRVAAWFGSLVNGPLADRFGRKWTIVMAVVVFIIGSAIQAGAYSTGMLFAGRAIAGFSVGMLTMIVPMYLAEVSVPGIRGTLVVLQQLSITIGICVSFWVEYGTHYIGGVRCAPNISYTGGGDSGPSFDPRYDVGPSGCTGQSEASWRVPFALQIFPALVLGFGMLAFPESPRFLMAKHREESALAALSTLRRLPTQAEILTVEFLAIKAEVLFQESFNADRYPGKTGLRLALAQYGALVSTRPSFHRLAVGCCVMFFQQFMGCNAMIYYAPTIFSQLGLSGNTTSLLATGVYGIVSMLSTLPALFLIDKIGRRPLLICGGVGTFVSLTVVAGVIGGYGNSLASQKAAAWTGIAFIYFYAVNFCYSFAPIGWVLPSEIFTLGSRSKAMSITTSTTWMSNFVIGIVTPDMLAVLKYGTYIFFAAFCLLAVGFVWFFVPETRGKSLEDMDVVFGDTAAHEEKERLFAITARLEGGRFAQHPQDTKDIEIGGEAREIEVVTT